MENFPKLGSIREMVEQIAQTRDGKAFLEALYSIGWFVNEKDTASMYGLYDFPRIMGSYKTSAEAIRKFKSLYPKAVYIPEKSEMFWYSLKTYARKALVYSALSPMLNGVRTTKNPIVIAIYRDILNLCETEKLVKLINEYHETFPHEKCPGPDDKEFPNFWVRLHRWLQAALVQYEIGVSFKNFRTLDSLYQYCQKNLSLKASEKALWAWFEYMRPENVSDKDVARLIGKLEEEKGKEETKEQPSTPSEPPAEQSTQRQGTTASIGEVVQEVISSISASQKTSTPVDDNTEFPQLVYELLGGLGWDGKISTYEKGMLESMLKIAGSTEKLCDFLEEYSASHSDLKWGENVNFVILLHELEKKYDVDVTKFKTLDALKSHILTNDFSPYMAEKLINKWWVKMGKEAGVDSQKAQEERAKIISMMQRRRAEDDEE